MRTASPEDATRWLAESRDLLAGPEFRALRLEHDAAFDWAPDDPRLSALAERTRNWFAGRAVAQEGGNPAIAQPAEQSLPGGSSPAGDRLARQMERL
jgi:hypothetical protein